MTTFGRLRTGLVSFALLAIVASCKKDEPPKPTTDEGKKSTIPVPTDVVFNDFLPNGGAGDGLSVKGDGGIEGGLGSAQTEATAAAETESPSKLKVIDPGA